MKSTRSFISLILICLCIIVIFVYLCICVGLGSKYSTKNAEIELVLSDVETIKARKQLVEIQKQATQVNKLIAYCLKKSETREISDMVYCKNQAINYLGYSSSYQTLKQTSLNPLKSELKTLVQLEKNND